MPGKCVSNALIDALIVGSSTRKLKGSSLDSSYEPPLTLRRFLPSLAKSAKGKGKRDESPSKQKGSDTDKDPNGSPKVKAPEGKGSVPVLTDDKPSDISKDVPQDDCEVAAPPSTEGKGKGKGKGPNDKTEPVWKFRTVNSEFEVKRRCDAFPFALVAAIKVMIEGNEHRAKSLGCNLPKNFFENLKALVIKLIDQGALEPLPWRAGKQPTDRGKANSALANKKWRDHKILRTMVPLSNKKFQEDATGNLTTRQVAFALTPGKGLQGIVKSVFYNVPIDVASTFNPKMMSEISTIIEGQLWTLSQPRRLLLQELMGDKFPVFSHDQWEKQKQVNYPILQEFDQILFGEMFSRKKVRAVINLADSKKFLSEHLEAQLVELLMNILVQNEEFLTFHIPTQVLSQFLSDKTRGEKCYLDAVRTFLKSPFQSISQELRKTKGGFYLPRAGTGRKVADALALLRSGNMRTVANFADDQTNVQEGQKRTAAALDPNFVVRTVEQGEDQSGKEIAPQEPLLRGRSLSVARDRAQSRDAGARTLGTPREGSVPKSVQKPKSMPWMAQPKRNLPKASEGSPMVETQVPTSKASSSVFERIEKRMADLEGSE